MPALSAESIQRKLVFCSLLPALSYWNSIHAAAESVNVQILRKVGHLENPVERIVYADSLDASAGNSIAWKAVNGNEK